MLGGFHALVGFIAKRFGPRTLHGIEFFGDEIRLVRLTRRQNRWKLKTFSVYLSPQEAKAVCDPSLHGYRLALGDLSGWIASQDTMPVSLATDDGIEVIEDPDGFGFAWSPSEAESILESLHPFDAPDELIASIALPAKLLSSPLETHWIGCRFLSRECQLWLMHGKRIHSFFRLDGGWSDEHLMRSQWQTVFSTELPEHWPLWQNAPLGILETGDPVRLAEFLQDRYAVIPVSWISDLQHIPEPARFAAATALGHGTALISSPEGILREDQVGRRTLAKASVVGISLGILVLGVGAAVRIATANARATAIQAGLSHPVPDSIITRWNAYRKIRESMSESDNFRQTHGGQLSAHLAAATTCLPSDLWIQRWSGLRDSSRWEISMNAIHSPSQKAEWVDCIAAIPSSAGFALRSSQTLSASEWKQAHLPAAGLTISTTSNVGTTP